MIVLTQKLLLLLVETVSSHFLLNPKSYRRSQIEILNTKTKSMPKTALNELIDILNQLKMNSVKPDCLTKRTGDYRIGLDKAITEALYLLNKERDQIKQAFENGFECDCMEHESIKEYTKQYLKNKCEN